MLKQHMLILSNYFTDSFLVGRKEGWSLVAVEEPSLPADHGRQPTRSHGAIHTLHVPSSGKQPIVIG